MKKHLPISLLVLLFACGGNETKNKEQKNLLDNLQVSVDTVIIDSGEEIFVPNMLNVQSQSADGTKLFSFYEPDFEFFEISLEEMKLLERHPFEKEGPESIKGWVDNFQMLNGNEIFLHDEASPNLFSLDGQKTKQYELDWEEIINFKTEGPFSSPNDFFISPDKSKFLFIPMNFGEPAEGLGIIDIKKKTGEIRKLPALDLTFGFQVIFQQENSASFFGDNLSLQLVNDRFIIHSGSTADIYTYDYKPDSLKLITFDHQLVENNKTGEFPHKADSRERQMEIVGQIRKQITFQKFYWDPFRKMYFRFGTKNFLMPNKDVKRSADCYLFAYDENLNLLGEKFLEEFQNIPYNGYFYQGAFYSYSPIGDEAGFTVYTFNF
ncbi:DUF4221 family protein [Algoriphagus halophilus]|uniref:TolB-like 6-blade propeller-like n=1 Tax=Algoriphagus halophilus TaxID=226505 RepID=A0A1N6GFC3_9BACT|nr:DUF4221 family protein [Algoriphagus halophilus]SIO06186.1 protein of unknown function [Algoriphagus halophilus]